jgi:hypothetical protein
MMQRVLPVAPILPPPLCTNPAPIPRDSFIETREFSPERTGLEGNIQSGKTMLAPSTAQHPVSHPQGGRENRRHANYLSGFLSAVETAPRLVDPNVAVQPVKPEGV